MSTKSYYDKRIHIVKYEIMAYYSTSRFLSFQTEEIAKEFLTNFRDLIEQAGDLI